MNNRILYKLPNISIRLGGVIYILFLLNICTYPDVKIPPNIELDSVRTEIKKCNSDVCKFKILQGMFWKYYKSNSKIADYYGRWAFEAIKNSAYSKELADGYDIKSIILLDEKKIDSAFYFLNKALIISDKVGYDYRKAWSYFGRGKISIMNDNSRAAIDNFLQARKWFLTLQNIKYPNDELDNYVIKSYISLNKYDSVFIYLQDNLNFARKHADTKSVILNLLIISDYYNKFNNIKESSEYLYNALKAAEILKDEEILSKVYIKIGDSFFEHKKNYAAARDYYFKASEFAQKQEEKKLNVFLFGQIARTYLEENKDSLAMEYYLKSLKIAEKINYRHALSESYLYLGYAYKKLGNSKQALENYKKCWLTQCEFCPPITFHQALIGIAEIYLKENNLPLALSWYEKSLRLADSTNAKLEIAKSQFGLGDYYNKINEFSLAEKYYLQSIENAKEVKSISLIKSIADTLSNYYTGRNNYKTALIYLQLARAMDDTLLIAEQQASMANLEMNFKFEQLNKENEAKTVKSIEEIKRQRIYLYSLISISVLLAVLGAVIFISYKRKKNDNILLTLQKEEIAAKNKEIEFQITEITHQKDEIEKISGQLHEADQMKLRFFTNISHEFRTPLTLIVSPLIKLMKISTDDQNNNLFSLMYRNSLKLQNLINRLLDISKIDKGELKLNLKKYNINKIIRTTAAMFQSIAEEKNIEFNVVEKSENVTFSFDAERIEEVINNLLSNAFKFTPVCGKITLELEVCDNDDNNLLSEKVNTVKIKVKDNGIGIPPESINKVFDRFYQCDSKISRNFEGSGIGLALTKELVELHNGRINVKSESDKWTEFTVILPMIISENDKVISDYIPQKNAEKLIDYELNEKEIAVQKQFDTILLVEDNADLRSYLKECLSKEFNIIMTNNGKEGYESAVKHIPDIVISDVMMPEKDGYQLTCLLKENISTSHIPVILLTAKAGRDSKLEGLGKGADDYIVKPFDEDELKLRIKNILQNRKRLQEKFRKQIIVNPSEIEVKSLDEQMLVDLTRIIEQEISNPGLDVEFVCEQIGLSRPQLYRKLKALTDLSINQFIRSIRLKRAAQLIEKKSATISEIAYMTGFENLSYFTKKFKEEFGKLPSEY